MTNEELQHLRMSEPELEIIIGEHLLQKALAGKPASDLDKRKAAKSWFTAQLQTIRSTICGNSLVQEYCSSMSQGDRTMIFTTICGLLLPKIEDVPVAAL